MIIVNCPICDGEVALDSVEAVALRCEACSVELEFAPSPAPQPTFAAAA
jgi:hypothetical protein